MDVQRAASPTGAEMQSRRLQSGLKTLAWVLFALAIAAFMMLSAPALLKIGIPYDAPYGPPLAKLHPGSYLLVLAWGIALASRGNPVGVALEQARREPLLTLNAVCMVAVFAWVVYQQGSSGAAYIIQTLWMPAIALFALRLLPAVRARQTLWLIMSLLGLNSAIALGEYALRTRLFPLPVEEISPYFRASALLGHPLLNANITTALLPAVTQLRCRPVWRFALGLLLVTSVLAFGARTAFVVSAAVYGPLALAHLLRQALRGRYTYLQLVGGLLGFALLACLLLGVVEATGLGDRIFRNLVWDSSASVRSRVWEAFGYLRGPQWWLGVSPRGIAAISLKMGLDPDYEAIENFWISAFLQFGIIGYVPFLIGLGALVVLMLQRATPAMRAGVVVCFVVASTTNSLTSKTVSLTLLALVAVTAPPVQRYTERVPRMRTSTRFLRTR